MGNRSKIVQQKSELQTIHQSYSGPIPPAVEMAKYAQINADFPNRIIAMAENQEKHRQAIEDSALHSYHIQKIVSTVFGFIIALSGILCGTYCIINDKDATGLSVIIADLAALAGVFIYSTRKK